MATLFDKQIDLTYQGLIKTTDNAAIGAAEKNLTDGIGNASTLSVGTTSASFTGTLDLTGATVTGLPATGVTSIIAGTGISVDTATGDVTVTATGGTNTTYDLASAQDGLNVDITLTGSDATVDTVQLTAGTNITLTEAAGSITIDASGGAAGLVTGGTGTGSMKNADSLVSTAAVTKGPNDFVIGSNAGIFNTAATDDRPYIGGAVVIGQNAQQRKGTDYAFVTAYSGGTTIGYGAVGEILSSNSTPTAIGRNAKAQDGGISIGSTSSTSQTEPGDTQRTFSKHDCIAIGRSAQATGGGGSISIGFQAQATSYHGFAIGLDAIANIGAYDTCGTSIGTRSNANAESGIALGGNAKIANTAHTGAIVIGNGARSANVDTAVIGRGLTAVDWVSSLTVNQLALLNYAGLNYADDTAAAAGGVPLGGIYHTTGAMKIRIA